jgi:3-hydroxybutyryl-CoA dehydrogenase
MIRTVAVVGAGTMGNGIAHVFAQNNFEVNLVDVNAMQIGRALQTIAKNFDRQISKGAVTEEQKKEALANISTFTDLREGVQDADLVVEAATENTDLKLKIFKEIDDNAPGSAILASNTSSISITKIGLGYQACRKSYRYAFYEPGAGNEAGRGDQWICY